MDETFSELMFAYKGALTIEYLENMPLDKLDFWIKQVNKHYPDTK